jgi:dihydroorotase
MTATSRTPKQIGARGASVRGATSVNRRRRGERALLLKGGVVVDSRGIRRADVLVVGTRVRAVGDELDAPLGALELDASECIVAPGLVDLHAHLREPGDEPAETIQSGARAAALGGFTAVVAMPNTDPPIDCAAVARHVLAAAADAPCLVVPAGAITEGRAGERLAAMGELAELGVRLFTDDGRGVQDAGVLRRAMEYASGLGVTIAEHCEHEALSKGAAMHEGEWSSRLGVPGVPAEAEESMIARDLMLANLTGARIHLQHVSTGRGVELVADWRRRGVAATMEVTPHHLALADAALADYDPSYKVNPPLRPPKDLVALREAVRFGLVDAIATDHAPHSSERKDLPLEDAAFGIAGLETALGVAILAVLLDEPSPSSWPRPWGGLVGGGAPSAWRDAAWRHADRGVGDLQSLQRLLACMSWRPAAIAGLDAAHGGDQGGPIAPGFSANLVVFAPERWFEVCEARRASRSTNTPFFGWRLPGEVRHTVFRGEPVVLDGVLTR